MAELTQMEIDILRILNGEDVPGYHWGAGMSACCEFLKALDYAAGTYKITDKGRERLKELGY